MDMMLFDHLVGERQQGLGDGYAQRFGGPEIDDGHEFRGLLDWDVARFYTFKDPVDEIGGTAENRTKIHAIAHQTSISHQLQRSDRGKLISCSESAYGSGVREEKPMVIDDEAADRDLAPGRKSAF